MEYNDPRPGVPTTDLVKEAIEEARDLVRTEVELAKNEIRREIKDATRAGIAIAAAGAMALVGITLLLVGIALAIQIGWVPVFVMGLVLLGAAATAGLLGYRSIPKKPMDETRTRVQRDINLVKEQFA